MKVAVIRCCYIQEVKNEAKLTKQVNTGKWKSLSLCAVTSIDLRSEKQS